MKSWKRAMGLVLATALISTSVTLAQQIPKKKYQVIVVTRFEAAPDVAVPVRYQTTIMKELASALLGTGKFKFVVREGDPPKDLGLPKLTLKGTVTRFYIGGPLNPGMAAHIKFIDETSNQVLSEADVSGKIRPFDEDYTMIGAIQRFARETAKIATQKFF